MAATAAAVAAFALLLVAVVLLAAAPRLRLFDDQRRRAVALAVFAVVALGGPLLANSLVRREAASREDQVADALFDALRAVDYDELRSADPRDVLGPAGAGVETWTVRPDGTVEVRHPVGVAWLDWCVVGEKRPDGDVRIDRTTSPCP